MVVASGAYQRPRVPAFAPELDPGIVQLRSSQYRDPSQLREGGVLVVGAANSGAEIALEVSGDHRTWLSGRHPGQEPFGTGSRKDRLVLPVVWCTGFVPDYGWIDLPVFDRDGGPVHDRGVVGSEPGLYFVGLLFLYALSSPLVGGVGRDAEHIAGRIAARRLLDLPKARVSA